MPRFVILRHELPLGSPRASHWDFMLEEGDALLTWAIDELPQVGQAIAAQRLANHRPAYLTYEGPISGERGHVTRWDAGTYELVERGDRSLRAQLEGAKLQGAITLVRASAEADDAAAQFWTLSLSQS